jgi:hypothetical protein
LNFDLIKTINIMEIVNFNLIKSLEILSLVPKQRKKSNKMEIRYQAIIGDEILIENLVI